MTAGVNVPQGPQAGDSSQTQPGQSPQAGGSRQTGDIRQGKHRTEPSAGDQRRGRVSRIVIWPVVAGALLVLAFSPVSRLAANGLPRALGNSAAVVTGPQHGNTTTIHWRS